MKSHSTFGGGRLLYLSLLGEGAYLWGRKSKIIEYIQAVIGEYVRWGSVRHPLPYMYVGGKEAIRFKSVHVR